jgi:hypothetical protein
LHGNKAMPGIDLPAFPQRPPPGCSNGAFGPDGPAGRKYFFTISCEFGRKRPPNGRVSARVKPTTRKNGCRADNMPASFDAIATSQRSAWRTVFFGVGGKLQIAFSFVAGLTALSTIVSLLCFSAVEVGLRDFVKREMPVVTTL